MPEVGPSAEAKGTAHDQIQVDGRARARRGATTCEPDDFQTEDDQSTQRINPAFPGHWSDLPPGS